MLTGGIVKKIEVEIVKCEKKKLFCLGCFPLPKDNKRRIEVAIERLKGK